MLMVFSTERFLSHSSRKAMETSTSTEPSICFDLTLGHSAVCRVQYTLVALEAGNSINIIFA